MVSGATVIALTLNAFRCISLLSDGFGAMKLFFDIKEKLPDLAVIVCQCRNYGDVDGIKGAVADALLKNTAPRPDNILGSRETTNDNQPSVIKIDY